MSSLLYAMGPEADRIFKTFGLNDVDKKNYARVIEKFDHYFIPQRNIIHVRAQFNRRDQKAGETIEEYIRTLYELSENADFPNKDDCIRDRLVLGIRDQELSEKLQLEPTLTLSTAVATARQHEAVKAEIEQQRRACTNVDRVGLHREKKTRRPDRGEEHTCSQAVGYQKNTCGRCGLSHPKGKCPAFGKKCLKCGGKSHFARVCKTKSMKKMEEVEKAEVLEVDSEEGKVFFIDSVESGEPPWRVTLELKGSEVSFKIDTGADVNIVSKTTWSRMGKPKLHPATRVKLTSPAGQLNVLGYFTTKVEEKHDILVYVIDSEVDSLLSRATSSALGLVKRVNSVAFSAVKCQPVKIRLKQGATPYSVTTARRVPIPLHEKVKKELQRMKEMSVIEEVKEPTEWVAPMVPVLKPNGDVRICVDLKKLNQAIEREKFVIPTFDDIIHQLRGSTVFSKLDAQSGFWQIPLDPETAKLTTFITPVGRFYMKRVPFGISSAPEIFMRTVLEILKGIEGVICYFDDILCHSKDTAEHEELLKLVHQRLEEAGLQLNKDKCEYRKTEVTFLGHVVDSNGCRPELSKVEAIRGLPEPSDVNELRRYLGMINYLGRYLPHLSSVLKPMNDLLAKEAAWTWGPQQASAFQKVKEMLTTAPVLAFYDPTKPTVVEADSSSYGLGACLLQQQEGGLKPVAFCSRTLTSTEQKYAQIEKECLAAVWACERFDRFLMGLDSFTLYSDHKPLIPLINSKDLSETPLRCQRMLIRLMRYKPVAEHRPGKTMLTSDTLSRSPASCSGQEGVRLQEDVHFHVNMISSSWPVSDAKLKEIRQKTREDVSLKAAFDYTLAGWPIYKQDVMLSARELYNIRNELSVVDGLLLRGDRIIIPYAMRREILERIHDGHLGISKCRERANQGVWWPRMSQDIQDKVSSCKYCLEKRPAQPSEPLLTSVLPERPFERIAVDIMEVKGQHYLVCVDYYSRYIDIHQLYSLTSSAVIKKMKIIFAQHGIANTVVSDNGSQFAAMEFQQFAKDWNFCHVTSSPHYPQSNGEAERAVKTAKEIVKQKDSQLALLTYRATPLPMLGVSPSELAFGRRLRTTLPTLPKTLLPRTVDAERVRRRDEAAKTSQKEYFDQRAHHLPELRPKDIVLLKDEGGKGWKRPGEVVRQCAPRSYIVKTSSGELRRNRRDLRLRTSTEDPAPDREPQPPFTPGVPVPAPGVPVPAPGVPVQTPGVPAQIPAPPPQQLGVPASAGILPQPACNTPPVTSSPTQSPQPYVTRSGRSIVKPARYQ